MLRKAALAVLLILFSSSAFASDLRVEGAKSYVLGFLAGNFEVYSSSTAVRDDVLFVLRRMTYPLSSWSWAQATVEDVSTEGDTVKITAVRPDISGFFSGKRPEAVEEWGGFLSLNRIPEMPRKKEEIVLRVNSLGEIEITKEARKQMLDAVTKDFTEALKWCRDNKDLAPKEYVMSVYSEMKHGVIPLPPEVVRETETTVKIMEGDKK